MLPAMRAGLVRILAADPKLMELAYGRAIFDRHGAYAADPLAHRGHARRRGARHAGPRCAAGREAARPHPTTGIRSSWSYVDEVAFLTAYLPDKALRERVKAALATLTTQGRAVGYCVVAALQDPRKEVMSIRNLFPTGSRCAGRARAGGHGARRRCPRPRRTADLISSDPPPAPGSAFVRLETDPDPVRVRAAWVGDADIRAMCADYAPVLSWPRKSRRSRRCGGMNTTPTTWRTDDPCPVCGTGLAATDDGANGHPGVPAVRLVGDLAGRKGR